MKFAERLAAHITPEWNSQYIKYDELKEFLYHYEQNAPIQDDEHLLQRYYARADEQFFQFCDKELAKINTFFAG
jgi:xenotropic and polytropic retrovirus receptor 1